MDNLSYIENLYREWLKNQSAVGVAWNEYFGRTAEPAGALPKTPSGIDKSNMAYRQGRVDSML